MRSWFALSWLALLAFPALVSATGHEPKVVQVALAKAYWPPGYDDNDRVQIVVAGSFPNSCYRVGPVVVERDAKKRVLYLKQLAYVYRGLCFDVAFPFSKVVDLGLIDAAEYQIADLVSKRELGKLPIARSTTSNSDDVLYAPVVDIFPYSDAPGESMLFIAGTFPAKCLKLAKVDVRYHDDIIEVFPVTELRSSDANDCRPQAVPFTHRLRLKDDLKGTYLLHVRSMDGQAVNKLAEFPFPKPSP